MAKRKDVSSEEESAEFSESESKPKSKKQTPKSPPIKKPVIKKARSPSDDEDESSESDRPVAKKAKRSEEASSSDVKVLKNKEGDSYVDIGKKKHVTVREFKGMQLVDIREFYTDKASGEDKPGKKGISLTLEQWNALKAASSTIDKLLKK